MQALFACLFTYLLTAAGGECAAAVLASPEFHVDRNEPPDTHPCAVDDPRLFHVM